jgi:hypothetical protein
VVKLANWKAERLRLTLARFSSPMIKAVAQRMMIPERNKDNKKRHYHAKICGYHSEEIKGSTCD